MGRIRRGHRPTQPSPACAHSWTASQTGAIPGQGQNLGLPAGILHTPDRQTSSPVSSSRAVFRCQADSHVPPLLSPAASSPFSPTQPCPGTWRNKDEFVFKKETAGAHKSGSSSFMSEGELGGLGGEQLGEEPQKMRSRAAGGGVVGNRRS